MSAPRTEVEESLSVQRLFEDSALSVWVDSNEVYRNFPFLSKT
jgi:hypothetical protein